MKHTFKLLISEYIALYLLLVVNNACATETRIQRIIITDDSYQNKPVNNISDIVCNNESFAKLVFGQFKEKDIENLNKDVKSIAKVMQDGKSLCKVEFNGFSCDLSGNVNLYYSDRGFKVGAGADATKTLACLSGFINNKNTIEKLIADGADIQKTWCALEGLSSNLTMLYQAISNGNKDFVKILLNKGANIDVPMRASIDCKPTGVDFSIIEHAIVGKDSQILSMLLNAGAIIPEKAMYSILFEVPIVWLPILQNQNAGAEILDILLEHGADFSQKYNGEFIIQLLEKQVVSKEDNTETLMDFAKRHSYTDVIAVLEKHSKQNSTKQQKIQDSDNDDRLFRYKQCELDNTHEYCECLINHVRKALGFVDRMVWLSGGPLTDADGRRALIQGGFLCAGLNKKTPTYQEQKAQEETGLFNGGKYKVSDVKFCDGVFGRSVCGMIENRTNQVQDVMLVYVNLYDSDNVRVGEAMANINTVAPHEKVRFETIGGVKDNVKSFKVREIMD